MEYRAWFSIKDSIEDDCVEEANRWLKEHAITHRSLPDSGKTVGIEWKIYNNFNNRRDRGYVAVYTDNGAKLTEEELRHLSALIQTSRDILDEEFNLEFGGIDEDGNKFECHLVFGREVLKDEVDNILSEWSY